MFSIKILAVSAVGRTVVRISLILAALALSACSGQVRNMVPAEFRDSSGRYDGQWLAQMIETPSEQNILGWKLKCSPMKLAIPLVIEEGSVTTRINDAEYSGFISGSGRFRLEIPTNIKMSASVSSEAQITNGTITLILQGDMSRSRPKGGFTLGVAELGNAGCTTKVHFAERPDSN